MGFARVWRNWLVMDKLSPDRRSENMRRIKSKGMKPELAVRSLVHRMGYRFRLHGKDLPGKPDLVFRSRKKVIFVHGCFWHLHDDPDCHDGKLPSSRTHYWRPKLERNRVRDAANLKVLESMGWRALIVWECAILKQEQLAAKIARFLGA